jgi:hypothetical protein
MTVSGTERLRRSRSIRALPCLRDTARDSPNCSAKRSSSRKPQSVSFAKTCSAISSETSPRSKRRRRSSPTLRPRTLSSRKARSKTALSTGAFPSPGSFLFFAHAISHPNNPRITSRKVWSLASSAATLTNSA